MISVESWEEMLDPPPEPFVVRSSRNWVGRLAALALLSQNLKRSTNQNIAICKERICWNCYFLPRNPGSEVSGSTTLERDSSNISIVHPTKGAAAKPTAASLSRREKLGYIRAFVY
jgi:hypothetical protein